MTTPLRVGIVGCGRVAEYHLRFLTKRPDVIVAGLADANLENARRLAARFGIANTYPSVDALFNEQKIDVLHVLTPPASHAELSEKAVERSIHVLVEKPLALTLTDATRVLERAAARKVTVCPDFIQLFHPRMIEATELIESGRFGRVVSCECDIGVDLNMPELREARGLHWSYLLPGGVLQNYVTHPLYLVMRWTGAARHIHVAPRSLGSLPQGLTDQLDILIDGETASAHVTVSLVAQPSPYALRILCERGSIVVDFDSLSTLTTTVGALPRSLARVLPIQAWQMVRWTRRNVWAALRKKLVPYHGLGILIDRLYRSVSAGTPPPVSPELALAVSKAEHEVLAQAAKVHLDVSPRASTQAGVRRAERVLVTGPAGFVGRHVVARLVEEGYYVRALVRPLSHLAELERLGVEMQFGDLRDPEAVRCAAEGMDVIVHVGAALRGSAEFVQESTVGGTRHVAQAARTQNVRRVIYISSMAVYDFSALRNGATVTAESPLDPRPAERGAASAAKRAAEGIALEHLGNGKPAWTVLRPSLIFGGDRDPLGMLGPRRGRFLILLGRPSTRLRLVHVDDVASAVVKTIQNPSSAGRVYTLSHPEVLTYREYLRQLGPSVMTGVRPVFLPKWFVSLAALALRVMNRLRGRAGGMSRRQVSYLYASVAVDSGPVRSELGWAPATGLREQVGR